MIKYSRNGVFEEVSIMIKTGASKEAVDEYIENLLKTEQITTRVYEHLITMLVSSY